MKSASTIADILAAAAKTSRTARAIEHDGRVVEMPYASLYEESLRIGGALRACGLQSGDRVAVVVPEVGTFMRAFVGISAAGLVPIPLVPPAQAGDVPTFTKQSRELLTASRATAVVTIADVAPLLAFEGLTPVPSVLILDTLSHEPALDAPIEVDRTTPALIQFTSGSTAVPKGVVISQDGLRANLAAIHSSLSLTSDDVGVSWLPLYHDMGLIGAFLTGIFASGNIIMMSPVLFLKRPTAWLDAISQFRGSISFAPNFAYDLCLRRVKPSQVAALDLSSWRIAGCGAEPIRCDTLDAFADRFACAGFRQSSFVASYGLAEHALAVAFSLDGITVDTVDSARLVRESRAVPMTDVAHRTAEAGAAGASDHVVRLVSCGRSLPQHQISIVDEEGRALPERSVGQIVAKGPSVMEGYFENPAATAEALRDGWLQTGDVGYLADGQLFVCGRTKDLIIRHGRKYHPPDLESAITSVPGMRTGSVVVFGVNHVDAPDRVVAVVEARASLASNQLADDVRRRVRETAGLELDDVVVAPPGTIPRTTSGKVRRSETRRRFETGTLLSNGRTYLASDGAQSGGPA